MHCVPAVKSQPWLVAFDEDFQAYLKQSDSELLLGLLAYRIQSEPWSDGQVSQFIIQLAPVVEDFIAEQFSIVSAVQLQQVSKLKHQPVFVFKRQCVQKADKRSKDQLEQASDYSELHRWLLTQLSDSDNDLELSVAQLAVRWLDHASEHAEDLQQLSDWCLHALHTPEAQEMVRDWVSFKLPQRIRYDALVPVETHAEDPAKVVRGSDVRHRAGFALTDSGMRDREVQAHAAYCIYCHKNQGDFCRRGFPVKKSDPSQGLKEDPFGLTLTGCPLDEKISEMQRLASQGYVIAPLAVVMIDNPLCPMTGHRICNDCMKSCIYQKQTPVNVPQIETSVLKSVLDLPWGVEVYDLLLNWNPLRAKGYILAPENGDRVLVMGMGPAGFTLANQLLMSGYTVVGMDGLKIETIEPECYQQPIQYFKHISQSLDARRVLGFGGVAEYGITARWDKNFLSLILITLLRRALFKIFGGVRFGGTIQVEDVWQMGFDHLALAVGAGLPRALSLPGSLAPGVRQANDFLMALQLSGAYHADSLAGLEVQLPAVVIGGGLTGIDTATEVQAYYILQIQRVARRYQALCERFGATEVRVGFDARQLRVLDQWLLHAEAHRQAEGTDHFNVAELIHAWGGVTVIYRKHLKDSPAYQRNYEEVIQALEEGVLYAECFAPTAVMQDEQGHCRALSAARMQQDDEGQWHLTEDTASFPAKSIFVATGAQPNVAYGFEHQEVFERQRYQYVPYFLDEGQLRPAPEALHCKSEHIGLFTSYQEQGRCVSFLGDTHKTFHGSVVKAMASAMRVSPLIDAHLSAQRHTRSEREASTHFLDQCARQFTTDVQAVSVLNSDKTQLTLHAPQVASRFLPGHFVRLQTYESNAVDHQGLLLHSEGVALPILSVNVEVGTVDVVLSKHTVSERILSELSVDSQVSLMGPTGVRAKIPKTPQTVLIMVDVDLIPQACVLGCALRDANHIVCMGVRLPDAASLYLMSELHAAADKIIWQVDSGEPLPLMRSKDLCVVSDVWAAMLAWLGLPEQQAWARQLTDVRVLGPAAFVEASQAKLSALSAVTGVAVTRCDAAVYGPMQCMLKGVCAQCLQWQIDPVTGERTKAVYACSWQNQPIDRIDLEHLAYRQALEGVVEGINARWLDYHDVP
jgi:NADPH-dependent glutamate synthase beta subunit-like oxidoreductase